MIHCQLISICLGSTQMTICTTCSLICRRCGRAFLGVLLIVASVLAQGVDPAMLLKPPADSWPTYHGEYSGQRHSRLTEITPANVSRLAQVWKFDTGQNQQIKASPILVNGIIFVSAPD